MSSELTAARPRLRYRPGCAPPPQSREARTRARHRALDQYPNPEVVDDFGTDIPVTAAQLNVLETYLGHLLDRLFERTAEQPSQDKGEISC